MRSGPRDGVRRLRGDRITRRTRPIGSRESLNSRCMKQRLVNEGPGHHHKLLWGADARSCGRMTQVTRDLW